MLYTYFQYFYQFHLYIFVKLCLEYRAVVLFLPVFQLDSVCVCVRVYVNVE